MPMLTPPLCYFHPLSPLPYSQQHKLLFQHLCGGKGLAETGTTLAGVEALTANNLVRLLDNLLTLGQDKFDVAGVRHVGVDLRQC